MVKNTWLNDACESTLKVRLKPEKLTAMQTQRISRVMFVSSAACSGSLLLFNPIKRCSFFVTTDKCSLKVPPFLFHGANEPRVVWKQSGANYENTSSENLKV